MAGVFGGINLQDFQFKKENNLAYQSNTYNEITYGRKYIDKFDGERFLLETEEYICIFEGFLFDTEEFENQREFIRSKLQYKSFNTFIKDLDGIFSIFIYFKNEEKIILTVDHLASIKLFFSQSNDEFIFSSDLFDITNYYRYCNKNIDLELDSVYFFLGFGSNAIDKTLFENIYKLEPSSYLEFDKRNSLYNIVQYQKLDFEKNDKLSENIIIDTYEKLISSPMERIVKLNNKYNLEHIAGLSGGLDSKSMAVMMSENVRKLTTFTFAEYKSLDQSIAQDVSSSIKSLHNFISLDNGNCLEHNFSDVLKQSNGLMALHTMLHGYNSLININTSQFGLLLTGQIGDAIFGSHFIGEKTVKEYITSKSHYGKVPDFIYSKIGFIESLLNRYNKKNAEAYIYEGRISCGTMYGDIISRNRIDSITPFYSKKLLNFTLTVPEEYRIGEYIYIKWLKRYHPTVLEFKWDKCDCRPTSKLKVKVFKYIYTIKNAIKKRLKMKYDGMNPFDVWYRENPNILENLQDIYEKNIDILDFNQELKNDVEKLFYSDIDRYKRNKFVVISLLLSLKLHLKGDIK